MTWKCFAKDANVNILSMIIFKELKRIATVKDRAQFESLNRGNAY